VNGTDPITRLSNTAGNQVSFWVKNTGALDGRFSTSCTPTGAVTAITTCPTIGGLIAAGDSVSETVIFTTGAAGTGSVKYTVTPTNPSGPANTGIWNETVVNPAASVTPDGASISFPPNTASLYAFSVTNTGSARTTYSMVAVCSGSGVSNCSVSSSTLTLNPQESQPDTATFTTQAPGTDGTFELRAQLNGSTLDAGTINVHASTVSVDVTPHNGDYQDVRKCLADCFEATVRYSTPPYYSLDTPRSVTLVYRRNQAMPNALVQVDVTDNVSPAPDKMSIRLQRPDQSWVTFNTGSQEIFYVGGLGTSRLAAQFDASGLATGAYNYTVVVRSWRGSSMDEAMAPIRVLVDNETNSVFGAGWSLSGFQRAFVQADGSLAIAEGNGSIAFFQKGSCGSSCSYSSPAVDFSTVTSIGVPPNITGYQRTYRDGSVATFNASGQLTSLKDRFNNQTSYAYDGSSRLWTITDPASKVITLGYGADGKLDWISDPGNRSSQFTISGAGDVIEIIDPDGVYALRPSYAVEHRMKQFLDRRGSVWAIAYDFADKLAADTLPTITADGGSVRPVVGFRSMEAAELVDPASGLGTSGNPAPQVVPSALRAVLVNPRGFSTAFAVDRFGAPTRIEEPLGRVTTLDRDANSLIVRTLTPSGRVVKNTWGGPDLTQVVDSTSGQTINYTYETTYHQLTQVKGDVDSLWNYWSGGKLDSSRAGSSSRPVIKFTYDSRGRILTRTDAAGHGMTEAYNSTQWMNLASTVVGATTTSFKYDGYGRVDSIVDAANKITVLSQDSLNRMTRRIGPLSDTTKYVYDSLYLRQLIDAKGQTYLFSPNALGWLEVRTDPAGAQDHYAYDRDGNLTQWISRRAQTISFTYDTLDALQTRIVGTDTMRYRADPAERFVSSSNTESIDTIKFDPVGRAEYQISVRGGIRYELHTTHDIRGLPTAFTMTSPWADTISYHYNGQMLLDTLTDLAGGKTSIHYDTDQLADTLALPTGQKLAGHFPSMHTAGELTFVNNAVVNQAIGIKYNYNSLGQVSDRYTSNMFSGREYRYDAAARDTAYLDYDLDCPGVDLWDSNHAWYCSQPPTKVYRSNQEHYQFDKLGNRTDLGAELATGNRLVKFNGDSLVYDSDGNLTRRIRNGQDVQRLYWNSLGQLVAAWTSGSDSVNFGYNAFGRRVRKSTPSSTSRYVWNDDDLLAEVDSNGNRIVEYTYYPGTDQPHSERRGGTTYYYLQDFPGNIVGLLNGANTLVNQYMYKPFGADDGSPAPTIANSLRFGAREWDTETGLYYVRSRYYDPQLGRFISEDPDGFRGGLNQYAFGYNNPVSNRDPSGLCPPLVAVGGYEAVAAAIGIVGIMAATPGFRHATDQFGRWASRTAATLWITIAGFLGFDPEPPKDPKNDIPPIGPTIEERSAPPPPPPPPGFPPSSTGATSGGSYGVLGMGGGGYPYDLTIVTCFVIKTASIIVDVWTVIPAGTQFLCSDGKTFWK
jgi:RHS repeat-associated protein